MSTAPSTLETSEVKTILIVDDEPANLAVLSRVLQPTYRVRAARSGQEALRVAQSDPRPDLVLLDIMMPEMDGHAVLAELKKLAGGAELPVIFVTALADEESEERGLELGAVDYLTKPIQPTLVMARVRLHLELKAARDALASQNIVLEKQVAERTHELKGALDKAEAAHHSLKKTYFSTLMAISALIDLRSTGLGDHSRRVADVSKQIAVAMGLGAEEVQDVFVAALLHDIGMIGLPDDHRNIPMNSMSREQLAQYQSHPNTGADVLAKIDGYSAISSIVRYHHEHYNGKGFPTGLSGLDIPLGARIISVVSDYDDLHLGRMLSQPVSVKQSLAFLHDHSGSRYDPSVIKAFDKIMGLEAQSASKETGLSLRHLQVGMVLARDIRHPSGYLLLSKGTTLNRQLIDQLVDIDKSSSERLTAFVHQEND